MDATKAVRLLEAFLGAEAADALQNQHANHRHYPRWIELTENSKSA